MLRTSNIFRIQRDNQNDRIKWENEYTDKMLSIFNSYDALLSGDPLYVGFDLTIASFDSISEVSMVSA